ncbi:hypothetical protein K470DRAFT_258598 [Piedraia hortae CBS 480.64]|uniref:Required for respiratory growth protein 8, mitochondrial n=1 Tax=Piedraia hortae CBS 480.64 TaxID=1314780 RepID=A0A6A7BWM2_9PEZI|nr:hypothetical protein K470DRAFT_258598 [Piedraia hortae CBS 480.64]
MFRKCIDGSVHFAKQIHPIEQPTIRSSDGLSILRPRSNGKPPLPLPPIMDPIALEARGRYTKSKARQESKTNLRVAGATIANSNNAQLSNAGDATDLENNPYAQALASPIRQCRLSGARVPRFFLVPLAVVDGKRFVPCSSNGGLMKEYANSPRKGRPGSSHILCSRSVITGVNRKTAPNLVTQRLLAASHTKKKLWECDSLEVQALEVLRGDVLRALRRALFGRRPLVVRSRDDWDRLDRKRLGVLLGLDNEAGVIEIEGAEMSGVAVQFIGGLMGSGEVEEVLDQSEWRMELKGVKWIAFPKRKSTRQLLYAIMRLEGFLKR